MHVLLWLGPAKLVDTTAAWIYSRPEKLPPADFMSNVSTIVRRRDRLTIGLLVVLALGIALFFLDWLGAVAVMAVAAAGLLAIVIFHNPFLGLLAIVIALPFERIGSLEIAGVTLRLSQALLMLTVVAWLLDGLARRKLEIRSNPLVIPVISYIFINLLSLTQAVNLKRGMVALAATVLTMLVAFIIPQLVISKEQVKKIFIALFIVTILVSIFGLYQFVGDLVGLPEEVTGLREQYTKEVFGFPRIQGTALEPLYFVNFLILPITLAATFLISRQKVKSFWLLIGVMMIGTINVVLALSRAGWIALIVSFLIIGFYYYRKIITPRQLLIGALVILVTVGIFVRVFDLTEDVELSLQKFSTQAVSLFQGASFFDRVSTFTDAAVSFQNHPWLGIGVGNFGPTVAPFPTVEPEHGWLIVNNIFIEVAAETGIFGLLTFIGMLLILFIRSVKAIYRATSPWLKAALVGSLAAFIGVMVQYQTFSILYIMHIWLLFGLLIALQNMILINKQSR